MIKCITLLEFTSQGLFLNPVLDILLPVFSMEKLKPLLDVYNHTCSKVPLSICNDM